MADTAPTDSAWKWLYRGLAMTGIAVGIFIIAAGLYLLSASPSWYTERSAQTQGCAAVQAEMKKMKADMEKRMKGMHGGMPNMPSMSPTPNMPTPPR